MRKAIRIFGKCIKIYLILDFVLLSIVGISMLVKNLGKYGLSQTTYDVTYDETLKNFKNYFNGES